MLSVFSVLLRDNLEHINFAWGVCGGVQLIRRLPFSLPTGGVLEMVDDLVGHFLVDSSGSFSFSFITIVGLVRCWPLLSLVKLSYQTR